MKHLAKELQEELKYKNEKDLENLIEYNEYLESMIEILKEAETIKTDLGFATKKTLKSTRDSMNVIQEFITSNNEAIMHLKRAVSA